MKKSTAIALIVAAVCLVAGMAAIGVFVGLNHDLSFGDMIDKTVVENYEIATKEFAPDFERISIIDNEAEIELILSEAGIPRIEYSVVEDRDYIVTVEDGILDIRVDDNRSSFLNFNIVYQKITLKVYLTEAEYESLTIDSSSGSVIVPTGFTFGEATIEASSGSVDFEANVTGDAAVKTSSGSVKAANLQSRSLSIETSSGSISLTDAVVQNAEISASSGDIKVNGGQFGDIDAGTSSGSISIIGISAESADISAQSGSVTVDSCTVSGDAGVNTSSGSISFIDCTAGTLSVQNSSGSINLERTVVAGTAQLKNSSGGVKFDHADAGELYVETTSGSVKGSLLTGKMFDVRTTSGGEDVPASDREGGMCNINTTSGSVRITIAE